MRGLENTNSATSRCNPVNMEALASYSDLPAVFTANRSSTFNLHEQAVKGPSNQRVLRRTTRQAALVLTDWREQMGSFLKRGRNGLLAAIGG